ncbi:RNA methyltransferase, TrmA family [Candidatus Zixiibacteriota bacterium]|nr:RNA methyltransferase, TrmA family [candidate division Zixibacteria bacterium]
MSATDRNSSQNRNIEAQITDLAFDGKAVGQIDGKITFFDSGLPGETVRGEVTRKKARYNYARVSQLLVKSPDRIDAPCRHFEICGGCTWQDLNYEKQLFYKRKQVVDCLRHIGHLDNVPIGEIIGAGSQFFYRNKMEFSFNTDPEQGFVLGLHRRGQFDRIFDINQCLLQSENSNRITVWFRQFVEEKKIPVYNIIDHSGFVRFLVIREGKNTEQVMLNIVTADGDMPYLDELISEATSLVPSITTIVQNINSAKANIARGDREKILFGPGFIEEKLFEYTFRIYPNSFFQTNTYQAERLYGLIYDMLEPSKDDLMLDLYCGAGTIGICAAGRVGSVIGVELEPAAIRAARENADLNNIGNIVFHIDSVQNILMQKRGIFDSASCAVIDPPRAGLHPKALKYLAELALPRLAYVSCNPATFARDAAFLMQAGYKIIDITPIDMFPHTMHIELVAILKK